MQRRNFLKSLVLTPVVASSLNAKEVNNIPSNNGKASIIYLDKCDGCREYSTPRCVVACKDKNLHNFPEPIQEIPNYFPQKGYEDYSNNRDDISRLSPYNWTFVENVNVNGKDIYIPRRCMHCDDPTCQKVCPFGVISKEKTNAVHIDDNFCFGGAKCRDVCPWGIPQRQAGVGIYLKIAPKLAGGGAMYKCDMCKDLLEKGQKPACEVSCPRSAIVFGNKDEILQKAKEVKRSGKYIYGDTQNGGTNTFYISSIDFHKIDEAIAIKYGKKEGILNAKDQKMGRPHMNVDVQNMLNKDSALVKSVLLAPVAGVIAGAIAVAKSNKK